MSSYIRTFTGRLVDPLNLKPEDIDIRDIAHALAHMCRFNGHVNEFYSVAEHSIRCSEVVPVAYRYEALLHDRSETYLPDMTRPVKYHPDMEMFRIVEKRVDAVSGIPFGLSPGKSDPVEWADKGMCAREQLYLMNGSQPDQDWLLHPYVRHHVIGATMPPKMAEELFLRRFDELRPTAA